MGFGRKSVLVHRRRGLGLRHHPARLFQRDEDELFPFPPDSSAAAAIRREGKKLILIALKQTSRMMTEAKAPPAMNQNRFPSKPHVLPAESSALFVSVNL